jgi:membrane associated rhomboid family serine protease
VEEATGSCRFIFFYLACGVVAAQTNVSSGPASIVTHGGASGAVAGVIGAYLLLRPCARITVIVLYIALRVRAYWVIGGWALLQLWQIETRTNDNIAYWAHIGGLLGGMGLLPLLRHQGVRLFECVDSPPVLRS